MNEITNFFDFNNFEKAMKVCTAIADSNFCPQHLRGKAGDVFIAIQYGLELGFKPMQGIQQIAIINGLPTIWGPSLMALVIGHPEFDGIHEDISNDKATVTLKRKNMDPITRSFSISDAQSAGLTGKDNWKKYQKRMLQYRARTWAINDLFPDVTKGIYTKEEAEDIGEEKRKDIKTIDGKDKISFLEESLAEKTKLLKNEKEEKTISIEDLNILDANKKLHESSVSRLNDLIISKNVPESYVQKILTRSHSKSISDMTLQQINSTIESIEKSSLTTNQ